MRKYIDILNEALAKEDVLITKGEEDNEKTAADTVDVDGDGEKEPTKKLLNEEERSFTNDLGDEIVIKAESGTVEIVCRDEFANAVGYTFSNLDQLEAFTSLLLATKGSFKAI